VNIESNHLYKNLIATFFIYSFLKQPLIMSQTFDNEHSSTYFWSGSSPTAAAESLIHMYRWPCRATRHFRCRYFLYSCEQTW